MLGAGGNRVSVCAIEDCERPAYARHWCSAHYQRYWVHGDPLGGGAPRGDPSRPCAVPGCDRPVGLKGARGWCQKHYTRWRTHGDPTIRLTDYGSGRTTNGHGYVMVKRPGHPLAQAHGWVMEHRAIAYDAGLLTDVSMVVHHVNGIKDDNRLENLKVMTNEEHTRHHESERRGRVVA